MNVRYSLGDYTLKVLGCDKSLDVLDFYYRITASRVFVSLSVRVVEQLVLVLLLQSLNNCYLIQ